MSDLKDELVFEVGEAGRAYLGKNLPILNIIGLVSPLLGLLGTIVGMTIAYAAGDGHRMQLKAGVAMESTSAKGNPQWNGRLTTRQPAAVMRSL